MEIYIKLVYHQEDTTQRKSFKARVASRIPDIKADR